MARRGELALGASLKKLEFVKDFTGQYQFLILIKHSIPH
jgi:hypothetical protein